MEFAWHVRRYDVDGEPVWWAYAPTATYELVERFGVGAEVGGAGSRWYWGLLRDINGPEERFGPLPTKREAQATALEALVKELPECAMSFDAGQQVEMVLAAMGRHKKAAMNDSALVEAAIASTLNGPDGDKARETLAAWRAAAVADIAASITPSDGKRETTMGKEAELPATLLWVDFETTGFDEKECRPIQVAAIITDNNLREIASGEWMINEWPVLYWEAGARGMHETTGLAARIEPEGLPLALVDMTINEMVDIHFPAEAKPMLAGNSVHFDRRFLARWFPTIDQRLHHRHYDVSSAFEVMRRTLGLHPMWSRPGGQGRPHTALADLRETIADLKLLQDDFARLRQDARPEMRAPKPEATDGVDLGTFRVVNVNATFDPTTGEEYQRRADVTMTDYAGATIKIAGILGAWPIEAYGRQLRVSLATVKE